MDKFDQAILDLLQTNARTGLEAISEQCGLSVPSVQRRVKRLKHAGVITREVAVLSPEAMGFPMTFIVSVELEREHLHQLDDFRRKIRAESQVQQCYYTTGDADFVLICIARDMGDFESLTHRLFFDNSNVRRFKTSVVMERTKASLSVPVKN